MRTKLTLLILAFAHTVQAQLAITPLAPIGNSRRVLVSIQCKTNLSYRLETSTNLFNWQTVLAMSNNSGSIRLVDMLPLQNDFARFYRLTATTNPPPAKTTSGRPSFSYSNKPKPGTPTFGNRKP